MTDILEQAHALGKAITETEAYKVMQEAKALWEADEEAQRMEKESRDYGDLIRPKLIDGTATQDEMMKLVEQSEAINSLESVRRYNDATKVFEDLRNNIYQILALYAGGNAGCAGCSGCSSQK